MKSRIRLFIANLRSVCLFAKYKTKRHVARPTSDPKLKKGQAARDQRDPVGPAVLQSALFCAGATFTDEDRFDFWRFECSTGCRDGNISRRTEECQPLIPLYILHSLHFTSAFTITGCASCPSIIFPPNVTKPRTRGSRTGRTLALRFKLSKVSVPQGDHRSVSLADMSTTTPM